MDHTEAGHATFESEHINGEPKGSAVVALLEARNGKIEHQFQADLQINTKGAIKRGGKRRTRVSNACRRGEEEIPTGSRFIDKIPWYIWFDILLMLSLKELLICRCVSKTWRIMISQVEFAKKYFAKPEVHALLIRPWPLTNPSRTLYMVEPQNFKLDQPIRIKLDTRLKIPLCNSDLVLRRTGSQSQLSTKRKRRTKSNAQDEKFHLSNSCRGLFCLFHPYKKKELAVYNPMTGEYIYLPTPNTVDEDPECLVECALGFSYEDNQYKVIRMFDRQAYEWTYDPISESRVWIGGVAEIHTLGTNSWRAIGNAPYRYYKLGCPTYLGGAIHWLYLNDTREDYIICFNFISEKFLSIPPPDFDYHMIDLQWSRNIVLGDLRGCLCMSFVSSHEISLWVMKEYSVKESWTKEFRLTPGPYFRKWGIDSHEPICILSNGCLLLLQSSTSNLFVFEPNGKDFKILKLCGLKSDYFEVSSYVPSFVSLKDAVNSEDLEVLNINSRCAGFKVRGKKKTLSLEEKSPTQFV